MATPPSTFPTAQDLVDLQGDVVLGIPKRFEDFLFLNITNVAGFKSSLKHLIPSITTTADVQKMRKEIDDHKNSGGIGLLKIVGINIAFTSTGLKKLGITESIGDKEFDDGQKANAELLGDPGTKDASGNFVPKWQPEFLGEIDCLVFVAGECLASVLEGLAKVDLILGFSVKRVLKVTGNVRPDSEKGHEHFGFLDGVSFPCIPTLNGPLLPGQQEVPPGVLICGQPGDVDASQKPIVRPDWTKNGSILCYRQLQQLVPEFNKFLEDNPLKEALPDRKLGSELLGARLFGRWKSGAPTDIVPTHDDPDLAKDPQRNNFFDFSSVADQTKCPFAAHIRKTNPRTDLKQFGPTAVSQHMIMRQGIPYGPELTDDEKKTNKTELDRGLAFTCYQSNLANGFNFVQESWANNTGFPPQKPGVPTPGFDPIIGQDNTGVPLTLVGTDPNAQGNSLTIPFNFVVSKGGAYFFTPSITALKTKIAV